MTKGFIYIFTPLAFNLFTTILANPVNHAPLVSRDPSCPDHNNQAACDQCGPKGAGIWGIFPYAVPQAACFDNYRAVKKHVACPCSFNNATSTPAIIGYNPGEAFVDVTWNDDGDASSGEFMINVYSAWPSYEYGHPLIGSSFGPMSFTWGSSSEIYSNIMTTLPDPMTFTVLASPKPGTTVDEAQASIKVAVTYGTQSFTLSAYQTGTFGSTGNFNVTSPPKGTWWADEPLLPLPGP